MLEPGNLIFGFHFFPFFLLLLAFLAFSVLHSQIVFFRKRVVLRDIVEQIDAEVRVFVGVVAVDTGVVEKALYAFIDEVALAVLPFSIDDLNLL